jgi:hypothetical protein
MKKPQPTKIAAYYYLWWRCRELIHQTHQPPDITGIFKFNSIRGISCLCNRFVPKLFLSVNTKKEPFTSETVTTQQDHSSGFANC